ncbi:MAG: glycosyltransferase family 2 protein [Syntrophorhabdaceae bacterium]
MENILSLVIITKDTRDLLEGLLKSIGKDTSLRPFITETIIIDNASSDGTDALIRDSFPDAHYIRNTRNLGFAASVNRGVRESRGKYILLLNSDTILIPGEIKKMLTAAEKIPALAVMGPQLVYDDLSDQRSIAPIPNLTGELLPGSQRIRHTSPSGSMAPVDVPSLIGAAILLTRSAFDAVNGFDERFFFFLEETDYCMRTSKAGYRVVFFPGAKIIHLQGRTVRKTWIKGRMEYNISLRKFIKKHHTPLYALFFDAVKFKKALLYIVFLPFMLIGSQSRLRYLYYCRLVNWYFSGCPETFGLRG